MKQVVVAAVLLVAFFVGGPWFAGKVGPGLADAITQWATEKPCPTATASPTRPTHHARPHPTRTPQAATPRPRKPRHRKPHPRKPRASASATSSCGPSPSSSSR